MSKIVFPLSKQYDSKSELEPKEAQTSFNPQLASDYINKGLGFISGVVGQNPPEAVGQKLYDAQQALSAALAELRKMGAK